MVVHRRQALLTLRSQNALLFSTPPAVRAQFHFASEAILSIREGGLKGCCLPLRQAAHFCLYRKAEIICNNLTICGLHHKHKVQNDPC